MVMENDIHIQNQMVIIYEGEYKDVFIQNWSGKIIYT